MTAFNMTEPVNQQQLLLINVFDTILTYNKQYSNNNNELQLISDLAKHILNNEKIDISKLNITQKQYNYIVHKYNYYTLYNIIQRIINNKYDITQLDKYEIDGILSLIYSECVEYSNNITVEQYNQIVNSINNKIDIYSTLNNIIDVLRKIETTFLLINDVA